MRALKSRLLGDVPVIDIPCKNRAKHNEFRALILISFILLNITLGQVKNAFRTVLQIPQPYLRSTHMYNELLILNTVSTLLPW